MENKPTVLYHGSPHGGIEELEPRSEKTRDSNEGPVIFASPSLAIAITFTANTRASGFINDTPYVIIVGDREEFIRNDNGGHVYILPSDNFVFDHQKGMGMYEWTTKVKVRPIDKIEFSSSLDAMLENEVQVYFMEEETYKNLDDHHAGLEKLESENQRRGVNVKKF